MEYEASWPYRDTSPNSVTADSTHALLLCTSFNTPLVTYAMMESCMARGSIRREETGWTLSRWWIR